MAPEQAKGKVVDKRADVWAFGAVLYEMLTGRRPFDGSDMSEVMARVISHEPAWNALPATTPRSIHRLLRRCLVKAPKDRVPDLVMARMEIDDVGAGVGDGDHAPSPPVVAAAGFRARLPWMVAAVAAMSVAWLYVEATSPAEPGIVTRFPLALEEGQTLSTDPSRPDDLGGPVAMVEGVLWSNYAQYGVSATGTLAYFPGPVGGGNTRVPNRQLAVFDRDGDAEPLGVPPGPFSNPRVSPDGRYLAFAREGQ